MKSKIDVTIFHNGDLHILRASIYEELWKDYSTFRRRASMQASKGTEKGTFLARRYERAALLSLYAFFEGVVDTWLGSISRDNAAYEGLETVDLEEKCRHILRYCFLQTYTKADLDFSRLWEFLKRYEQHDLSLLEHIDMTVLTDMEQDVDMYFHFVESMTTLKRFPPADASTDHIVDSLGGMVKECRS
ncbi:MAG: hypothetical protein LKF74_00815 [Megasphaera sp.]|jgi:hypothetical protein|nr:hypothetical protein [Megasphaera sp.]MCH4188045.1 hypothetical protein [Megasphaera sp.]MCH4217083.1 hypothetical protein [Megasphaera sp.]